jgi:hypothetical protein
MFGHAKLDFPCKYFPLSAGIPGKNAFARIPAALEPEQFRSCFLAWAVLLERVLGEVMASAGTTRFSHQLSLVWLQRLLERPG